MYSLIILLIKYITYKLISNIKYTYILYLYFHTIVKE